MELPDPRQTHRLHLTQIFYDPGLEIGNDWVVG